MKGLLEHRNVEPRGAWAILAYVNIERLKRSAENNLVKKSLWRARLITESLRCTGGEPIPIRRAKALTHFLLNVPLEVSEDDLLAGDRSWVRPYICNYPDFHTALDPGRVEPEFRDELSDILSFFSSSPELLGTKTTVHGHCVPELDRLLKLGFEGIARLALKSRKLHSDPESLDYLDAVSLVCYASSQLGNRYAKLLESEWRRTGRENLLTLSRICQRVPAKPARDFYEALQSIWFGQLLLEAEDPPNAQSPGRLDQLLYPYYRQDIADGRLTNERVKELLTAFWFKMWEPYDVHDTVIGGLLPDGSDATNELSYLILEVQEESQLNRQLSIRYHSAMPEDFLRKACDVVRQGIGVPQFFNDETLVPALVCAGLKKTDARNYAIIGCIETTIPGRADPRAVAHWSNLPECLEWALNDGVCLVSGETMGLPTGDPLTISSYEELFNRYSKQVAYEVQNAVRNQFEHERSQAEHYPMLILSTLTEDCVERALDITRGGARYNWSMYCAVGIPDVANSLYAIKKLVFEQGVIELSDLLEALRSNFEGYEVLRALLMNRVPKYGTDDDSVDRIACAVAEQYCQELAKHRDPRGGKLFPSFFSFLRCVKMGRMVGALPEGRLSGEPLANNLCAWEGTNLRGPSALLKSAGKLPHIKAPGGTSILVDLTPSIVEPTDQVDPLLELIRTYFVLGGSHCEFTIVDSSVLKKAQLQPNRHRHITVRVAGYSARFVELSPELQSHIIERTASYYR